MPLRHKSSRSTDEQGPLKSRLERQPPLQGPEPPGCEETHTCPRLLHPLPAKADEGNQAQSAVLRGPTAPLLMLQQPHLQELVRKKQALEPAPGPLVRTCVLARPPGPRVHVQVREATLYREPLAPFLWKGVLSWARSQADTELDTHRTSPALAPRVPPRSPPTLGTGGVPHAGLRIFPPTPGHQGWLKGNKEPAPQDGAVRHLLTARVTVPWESRAHVPALVHCLPGQLTTSPGPLAL